MDGKQVAGYAGAAVAVAFGAALLWVPPPGLGGQAGTVGAAFAFVTGGLGALGVTASVPVIREQARREGASRALDAARAAQKRGAR